MIDDDLGRSASGMVARPGFERLVARLGAGEVGAVLCFDASRLARNARDWHHLLELCGLVEARVIDLDGVYDPCRPNDRLLLGMGSTHFLTRTLKRVSTEMSLHVLAYNIKRVIAIIGVRTAAAGDPCESAWNKDPVFGVIGIQSGPRGRRVHSGFHGGHGSQVWGCW